MSANWRSRLCNNNYVGICKYSQLGTHKDVPVCGNTMQIFLFRFPCKQFLTITYFWVSWFYKNIRKEHLDIKQKSHIIYFLLLLCLAVASVCLTTFSPLWQNFEKEWNLLTFAASSPEKTQQKSMDTPCSSS